MMRGMKPSLALAAIGVVGLAAWAGAFFDQPGSRMATASMRFVASLDKEQLATATFPFDSPERLNWHFIPRERKGLLDQGHDARLSARLRLRNHSHRSRCLGLSQGHDNHEPRTGP